MEPASVKIFIAAGIVSAASIAAPTINRFRNVPAATFALAGGIIPWLVLAILYRWPSFVSPAILGLVCVASLFLLAVIFFSMGDPSPERTVAVAVAVVGLCAGIYFGVLVGYPLLLDGL